MAYFGAAAFSMIVGCTWISFLVVKMNLAAMLGVIALITVEQLLLMMLPEAAGPVNK